MLAEVEQLLVIQDRDRRIHGLLADLERLPREEDNAKTRLAGDLKSVADTEVAGRENEVAIKGLELDIDTRKDTITKLKLQQYETRKNEEFQALNHEVDRYGEEIIKLEDRELEFMETGESLSKQLEAAKTSLAKTQDAVDAELALIAERRTQCETQLAETREGRTKLGADIDADLLNEFDRILANKKNYAVVELVGANCKGCHMRVTPATAGMARAARQLAHCDQCGRFLYSA
jgi:predicted  nucleic acid-binding Zn-ribbon protein